MKRNIIARSRYGLGKRPPRFVDVSRVDKHLELDHLWTISKYLCYFATSTDAELEMLVKDFCKRLTEDAVTRHYLLPPYPDFLRTPCWYEISTTSDTVCVRMIFRTVYTDGSGDSFFTKREFTVKRQEEVLW